MAHPGQPKEPGFHSRPTIDRRGLIVYLSFASIGLLIIVLGLVFTHTWVRLLLEIVGVVFISVVAKAVSSELDREAMGSPSARAELVSKSIVDAITTLDELKAELVEQARRVVLVEKALEAKQDELNKTRRLAALADEDAQAVRRSIGTGARRSNWVTVVTSAAALVVGHFFR
jgi:hypothetical protein